MSRLLRTTADGKLYRRTVLGENVGFARSIDETHNGFMNSAKHREAILNGGYRSVGIGVAQNGGLVYVVEVFRG